MKILLHSPFSQISGYGRDGIGLALALLERGHDVRLSVDHIAAPIPHQIAGLLTEEVDPPFDLALHHIEPNRADLCLEDAAAARANVLWTMWGWPQLPDEDWVPGLAEKIALFDHVLVYDHDSAEAFEPHVKDDRLTVLLGGYQANDWGSDGPRPRPPDQPYTFAMNGRLTVRKGVYVAYGAFLALKAAHPDCDARLVFRSTQPVFPPEFPLVPEVDHIVAHSQPAALRAWYRSIDTLLAPSAAEAKHLPPIEALACGTPVIASDITGHRGWATSQMLTWVPTTPGYILPGYRGGLVDPDDLAEAMWNHYTHQDEQRQKAALAARTLPAMLDWSKCVERLGLAIGMRL